MTNATTSQVLKTADVARLFRVTSNTVNRWGDDGKLPFFKTPGGHRRYARTDVEQLLVAEQHDRARERAAGAMD